MSVGLVAAVVPAQGVRPPTADEILVLHQAGLSEADLGIVLDKNGVPAVSAADLTRLGDAGIPETVMARLRAAAEKAAPRKVTIDDVIKMSGSGVPETAILEM